MIGLSAPGTIRVPGMFAKQRAVLDAPQRYKLVYAGRRGGKSRLKLRAAVTGHGPERDGEPRYAGIAQGWDVVWVAPDYKQAKTIWLEEIRPRFRGQPRCQISETDWAVHIEDAGTLFLRSAHDKDAIDNLRGLGANLGGAILDECAHFDLEYAWKSVVLPMLLDNHGWALLGSTPNRGLDGNQDRRIPSYFNQLCQQVEDGGRSDEWGVWSWDARDNPYIAADAFAALVAEYEPDDPRLAEEVYGKLLDAEGLYLAFPEWETAVHVQAYQPETMGPAWRWIAGLDWGYRNWSVLTLLAGGPDQQTQVRWDMGWKEMPARAAGKAAGLALRRFPLPEWIGGDSAMWAVTGEGEQGLCIAELFQAGLQDALGDETPPLIAAPKGTSSRAARKQLLHEGLRVPTVEGRAREPWEQPRLTFHPEARQCIRTIPKLLIDAKRTEDVDTQGDDHAYDSVTMALLTRQPFGEREAPVPSRDVNQGVDRRGRARNVWTGPTPTPQRVGFRPTRRRWADRYSSDPDEEEF